MVLDHRRLLLVLVGVGVAIALSIFQAIAQPNGIPTLDVTRTDPPEPLAVEWLSVEVDPTHRDEYLQQDAAIWTPALSAYPGFVDKATWLNPSDPAEVIFIIRWTSQEQWFSIPKADLAQIQQRFDRAFPFKHRVKAVRVYESVPEPTAS